MIFGGKGGFIKKHKPRGFRYTPIYYKPEEDQEEIIRKKVHSGITGEDYTGEYGDRLRERIRQRWKTGDDSRKSAMPARKMYIYVAAIIAIIMFWLLR